VNGERLLPLSFCILYNENMIRIYTLPDCEHCKEVKDYFNSKQVDYEEIDMSIGGNKQTIEMKKRFKRLGFKTYPIVIIDSKKHGELIFPEFDKDSIGDILGED